MKRTLYLVFVALIVLVLLGVSGACKKATPTPAPTVAPTATAVKTATPTPAATVTPTPTATAAKVIEMKFNNPWPPTHHLAVNVFDPWAKIVAEKTNGRVKMQNYHGGSLSKATEVWEGTMGGMWDYAVWVPSYKYEKFLQTLICELPFAFPDLPTGDKVFAAMMDKYANKEYSEVKFVGRLMTDLYPLWSTKKVTKIDDLKGMKIRITGRGWKPIIESWGAVPVSVDPAEMYSSLEKKVIDGVIYSLLGGWGYKLQEVTPYVVRFDAQVVAAVYIASKNNWNNLPADLQNLFEKELHPALESLTMNSYMNGQDTTWKGLQDKGVTIVVPTAEEMTKVRKSAMSAWGDWMTAAKAQGLPAEEIMAFFKAELKKYGITVE